LTLVYELDDALSTANASLSAHINSDYKIVIAWSGPDPGISGITWTDPDLGKILGFRANETSTATSHTATDTPLYTWLPTYHSNDQGRFWKEEDFAGGVSVSAMLSGISLTPSRRIRKITWDAEPAVKVAEEAAETSVTFDGTYYPEEERCLEKFVSGARTVSPVDTDAEGLSLKGCYYVPDLDVYTGTSPTVAIPSSMDGGGHRLYLSSSPDRYLWCTIDKTFATPKTRVNRSIAWYSVEVSLIACPNSVPAWNAP
jgi:hypothetical protein